MPSVCEKFCVGLKYDRAHASSAIFDGHRIIAWIGLASRFREVAVRECHG